MKISEIKYKRIILNLSVVGLLSTLFCCDGTKSIASKEITSISEKEVNYIPYYLKAYEANALAHIKAYQKSFAIYDSLAQQDLLPPFEYDFLVYLQSAYHSNSNISIAADTCVYRLIREFGYTRDEITSDSALYEVFLKSTYTWKDYYNQRKKFLENVNYDLRDTIADLFLDNEEVLRFSNINTPEYRKLDSLQQKEFAHKVRFKKDSIASVNQKVLQEIFSKYGYPDAKLIGNESIDERIYHKYFFNVLVTNMKMDSTYSTFFIPKVYEFLKKGKVSPLLYAEMKDQWEVKNKGVQLYRTIVNVPLADSTNLQKLRTEIGFPLEKDYTNYRVEDNTQVIYYWRKLY